MKDFKFNIETPDEYVALFQRIKAAMRRLPDTLAVDFVEHKCECGATMRRQYEHFHPNSQMLALSICEHFGLAYQEGVIAKNAVRAWCVFPDSPIILQILPSATKLGEPVMVDTSLPQFRKLFVVKHISRKDHLGGLSEEDFAKQLNATMHAFSLVKNPGLEVRI